MLVHAASLTPPRLDSVPIACRGVPFSEHDAHLALIPVRRPSHGELLPPPRTALCRLSPRLAIYETLRSVPCLFPDSGTSLLTFVPNQLLEAIRYIHDKGIVNRDIKLENLMLETENDLRSVKMVDFGLAKTVHEQNDRAGGPRHQFSLLCPSPPVSTASGLRIDMTVSLK